VPDFSLEAQHQGFIVGLDEVGRGPWAGPVVACAFVFAEYHMPDGLNDSKLLTVQKRLAMQTHLQAMQSDGLCQFALGECSPAEIDQYNILEASKRAMQRAFKHLQDLLPGPITHALVDGNQPPELPCPLTPVIKGDQVSASIAAASNIAKVQRDQAMCELAKTFPHYGWETNAGYGTKQHQAGLAAHGVTPHHRRSWRPIQEILKQCA